MINLTINNAHLILETIQFVELALILLNALSLKSLAKGYYRMKECQMRSDNGYQKL